MEGEPSSDPYIYNFEVLPGSGETGEAAGRDATGSLDISLAFNGDEMRV